MRLLISISSDKNLVDKNLVDKTFVRSSKERKGNKEKKPVVHRKVKDENDDEQS
jgi:hypothetical protein